MLEKVAEYKCFGGRQLRFLHDSNSLNCNMHFSIFLPPQAEDTTVPLLWWLSGLTCTDENFVQKGCAQGLAAELGLAIVTPDTSPRGEAVPDDTDGAWDFGLGAGFYVNAIQPPWDKHYQMYSYISEELPTLLSANFPLTPDCQSIFGHSMGGHGALIIALKNPGRYRSVSAMAPICAPSQCPWGQKNLGNYLGEDKELWKSYDACELIATAEEKLPLLVEQGTDDEFLSEQLKPELLKQACEKTNHPLELRLQSGYDHSYFSIASFMPDHLRYHAQALKHDPSSK